jgi:chromosome segregation ATPase
VLSESITEIERINNVLDIIAATTPSGENKILNEGVVNMDDNKVLEMFVNKFEKENMELKNDMRSIEKRMDDRLNRIEDMITTQNNKIDIKFDKIDEKFERINNKIDKVKDDIQKNATEQGRFWIGLIASMAIGVGGILVAWFK